MKTQITSAAEFLKFSSVNTGSKAGSLLKVLMHSGCSGRSVSELIRVTDLMEEPPDYFASALTDSKNSRGWTGTSFLLIFS